MAGLIARKGNVIEISDGVRVFQFPIESMWEFREVGLKDLGATKSRSERCFDIEGTNIAGYFSVPDDEIVRIEFYFGSADDLVIQVQIKMDLLIPLCFSIPSKR